MVEDHAVQRWPAKLATDPEGNRQTWHDIEFTETVTAPRLDRAIPAGTPGEVKSCYPYYNGGPGRWWIRRDAHEQLVEHDGVYALGVVERETDRVLRLEVVDAHEIDDRIDKWWDAGNGGRSASAFRQIPWTAVYDRLLDPEGSV